MVYRGGTEATGYWNRKRRTRTLWNKGESDKLETRKTEALILNTEIEERQKQTLKLQRRVGGSKREVRERERDEKVDDRTHT